VVSTRLALIGMGRMGQAVDILAQKRGLSVTARLERQDLENREAAAAALAECQVAIEFTTPDAAVGNVELCLAAGCPVVVGTTGWHGELDRVSALVKDADGALLWAPNFSIGAAILTLLSTRAGALIRGLDDYDVHVTETHHVHKRDAPSGTAIQLRDALSGASGRSIETTSIRIGHVPGRHEVLMDGPDEYVSLTHEVRDRSVFADGALRAALWLRGRKGIFTMKDVLTMTEATSREDS
jgi:4-hydroxy-tetrahydrodipicolinate reductase